MSWLQYLIQISLGMLLSPQNRTDGEWREWEMILRKICVTRKQFLPSPVLSLSHNSCSTSLPENITALLNNTALASSLFFIRDCTNVSPHLQYLKDLLQRASRLQLFPLCSPSPISGIAMHPPHRKGQAAVYRSEWKEIYDMDKGQKEFPWLL